MTPFTLEDLQTIARIVIGDSSLVLNPDDAAADAPGWDSLNHTLIILRVGESLHHSIRADLAAQTKTFADLVAFINRTVIEP